VGTDARGRRQYRYHDDWRTERDQEKHDRAIELAKVLPVLREQVATDLRRDDMGRDRVAAAAMRMLEQGLFRVGGERYAEENTSYGLATLRKEHVSIDKAGRMVFDYPAKSGQRRHITIDDPELLPVITTLKRRRTGPDELLAYRRTGSRGGSGGSGGWCDVRSSDINDYLQSVLGPGFSSKDVRTWLGTVLAALTLAAEEPPTSESSGKRRVAHAVKQVANQLGNTPAVARRAYVDPRVIDQFEDGTTLDLDKIDDATDLATIESAVIDLIEDA
jgi:DNA topoisomerase IB